MFRFLDSVQQAIDYWESKDKGIDGMKGFLDSVSKTMKAEQPMKDEKTMETMKAEQPMKPVKAKKTMNTTRAMKTMTRMRTMRAIKAKKKKTYQKAMKTISDRVQQAIDHWETMGIDGIVYWETVDKIMHELYIIYKLARRRFWQGKPKGWIDAKDL